MTKRVLVAGLFHETHSFVEGRTTLDDFGTLLSQELLSVRGDGSPLGGALDVALECGWQVVPVIDLRATPGPIVQDTVVEFFWQHFEAVSRREAAAGIDGVLLVLHGAMVSETYRDVEGEILRRIRQQLRLDSVPLGGVLDVHANVSPRMAHFSDALIAYQQNPHTDAEATGRRAAIVLDGLMQTRKCPVTVYCQPPIIWPPTGTGTSDDPMRTLQQMARAIEAAHAEILAVNVVAGFAFADTPNTGVSFTAVTLGDPELARRELLRLYDWALTHRELGNVVEPSLESVLPQILEQPRAPVLLVEPADNVGGGATGDGTGVLRFMLHHRIERGLVVINDPESVRTCLRLRPGDTCHLQIGGKQSRWSGGSVELDVQLISTSDGHFELEDRHSHLASMCGTHVDMGPCAVVRQGGIWILLTSKKTPPFDLGQLRSQGIQPEVFQLIGVKGAVAHRRAYDPIAAASFSVSTPGACSSNLRLFPYQHVRRPVYPLDD